MVAAPRTIDMYTALADFLAYPEGENRTDLAAWSDYVRGEYPTAATHLDRFLRETEHLSAEELQEIYTRAFDVAPQCIPYLSVYLFGAESFKRAELMAGLKEVYERGGFDCGQELPDHLAVVLRCASAFSHEEWNELMGWCAPGPIKAMIAGLKQASSPYLHVLLAIRHVLQTQYPREFASC